MKTIQKSISLFFVSLLMIMSLSMCGQSEPAEDHFKRGNELSLSGEFEEAVAEYEQALEDEPENVDVLSNLGVAYYNLGQLDKAIEQYSKAIEIAPKDADIRSNLAAAYVQQYQTSGVSDQLESALEEYQTAVELDTSLAEAFFGLGVVYALLGRNDDAIQAFEEFQGLDTGQDSQATDNAEEYLKLLRGQ
ncbi:MAG: tetratricopeptide repeat protein [Anaerolineae bacterium]